MVGNIKTYIIAEIGVNHNGNLELAKESILAAKTSGADAVKFQTFKTDKLVTKRAEMASYQKENTSKVESQYDMLKRLELTNDDFLELRIFCDQQQIDFLSSPFDEESASLLKEIGVKAFKLGSGELTNIPFLRQLDLYQLPVLLSTGMADMDEVKEAVSCFEYSPVTVLHCTSNYPADFSDINLRAITTLSNELGLPVGYSDHSNGYEVAICAVAMGAKVIEKHFTLDRNLPGPDHKASLNPTQFQEFVDNVRLAETFLGDGIKRCMPSEESTRMTSRKSVVSKVEIKVGTKITQDMLTIKRPGTGIAPAKMYSLIGRETSELIGIDTVITEGVLKD